MNITCGDLKKWAVVSLALFSSQSHAQSTPPHLGRTWLLDSNLDSITLGQAAPGTGVPPGRNWVLDYRFDSVTCNNCSGGGGVSAVTASAPILSSGGTTPNISIPVATSLVDGYLSHLDWATFNGKQAAGNYITALTGDVTATGPGSVASTISNLAVTNAKIANSTIDLTTKVTGVLPAANGGGSPTTRNLFVDGSRTDTYTPDGSISKPFLTIGAAVTQIITNGDNCTAGHAYAVIIFSGTYSETISLNSSSLCSLTFANITSPLSNVQNTTVNGLTSTSNNTQLATVIFSGITFNGGVTLTGDINNTNFASTQVLFFNCQFNGGAVNLTNINNVNFYGGQIQGATASTWQNVAFAYVEGAEGFISGTTLHLVQNNGANQPSQSSGNYFLMSETKNYATVTIDAGSEMDSLLSYFGSGSAVTNNGIIHSWGSNWNGTLTTNNGSTTRVQGDLFLSVPTINSGSTFTNRGVLNLADVTIGASAVAATNAVVVTKDGHYKSTQTTAPTTTLSGNAGTGGTPSCTVTNATDSAGKIALVTGTSAWASGTQCTVNFNLAYNLAPICVVSANNATSSANVVSQQINFTTGTSSLVVSFGIADTAQHTYNWMYHCVETQ